MSLSKWVFGLCLVIIEIYLIANLPAYFGDWVYMLMSVLILMTIFITAMIE